MMNEGKLWLNLGCGDDLREAFVNVDRVIPDIGPNTIRTVQFDLSEHPWPWASSSVDFIMARDIIEHLPDKIGTMNQAWMALKRKGMIYIDIPTTDGRAAFQDPTHVSFWNRNSFWYFEDGNIYRERFAKSYGIMARFLVKYEKINLTMDGPKLEILLEAVK
jgi:hypothetical protein